MFKGFLLWSHLHVILTVRLTVDTRPGYQMKSTKKITNFEFSSRWISRDGYTVPDKLQIPEMTDFSEKSNTFHK